MKQRTYTVMPFLIAMVVAVAGMGTDVYQICRRQVGTLEIEPWLQSSSTSQAIQAALSWFKRLRLSWAIPVTAAVALALLAASLHGAGHGHGAVLMATVAVGTLDVKEIRESINKLGTDMSDIVTKAGAEKRELSAEEETSFDKMDAEREKLLKTETRLLKVADLEAPRGRQAEHRQVEFRPSNGRQTEQITSADRLEAFRSWLLAGAADAPLSQKQRAAAERAGVRLESKQFRMRLPEVALRSRRPEDVKEWEERALSTLNAGSPEDGSYLIANELMRPLERALLDFGGMRQVSTVLRTGTGANLPIPTSDDTSNKGQLIAENTQIVEKDTEFGQLVLGAFKFTSKKVLVSLELLQDSSINLAQFLGAALGERIGRITNDYFTTGTGSSEPNGIVTAATSSSIALAAKTPTYLELVAIQHSVDPAYRTGARWMFADSMLAELKKIVDGQSRPLWIPDTRGGAPDTILGDPFTINQSMAAAAATGSGKSILYGQLSKYLVRDVMDIMLLRLDELYAEYGQVAFLAFSRHDGDLLDAGTHPVKYGANHS